MKPKSKSSSPSKNLLQEKSKQQREEKRKETLAQKFDQIRDKPLHIIEAEQREEKDKSKRSYETFNIANLVISDKNESKKIRDTYDIIIKLELISEMFSKLRQQLNSLNLSELPDIYSISKICISSNPLQKDRYFEEEFLYYQTEYRKKFLEDLEKILFEEKITYIKGIQATGKSFFLSDFVLRNRVKAENSDFRILYINDCNYFKTKPQQNIINEFLYALYFDIQKKDEIFHEFPSPPGKYSIKNQMLQWLIYLEEENDDHKLFKSIKEFLKHLHRYFKSMNKKLILICDQINNLNTSDRLYPSIYNIISQEKLYDSIIICSSSNDLNLHQPSDWSTISFLEINPLQIFNEKELKMLIFLQSKSNRPKDILEAGLEKYVDDLFKLVDGSITEYFFYKKTFLSSCCENKIKINNFEIAKDEYIANRKFCIKSSEEKYLRENEINIENYLFCFRKIRSIKYYNNLIELQERNFEIQKSDLKNENINEEISENLNLVLFSKEPNYYNKQLFFFLKKNKSMTENSEGYLLCQSSIILEYVFTVNQNLLSFVNPLYNTKHFSKEGDRFESLIQIYYLRPNRKISYRGNKSIDISKINYFYSCGEIIEDLKTCYENEMCKVYHFFQSNHWAFDSLIYDGFSKSLFFIQITVNENHNVYYKEINNLLSGEKEDVPPNYQKFFSFLFKEKIAENNFYLWITDCPKEKISRGIDDFNKSNKKKNEAGGFFALPEHKEVHDIISGKLN